MTDIVLQASDKNFGQLSCNFRSSELYNSTLAEYTLQKGVTNTSRGNRLVDSSNALFEFRRLRKDNYNKYLQDGMKNVVLDESFRMLNPDVARGIVLSSKKSNAILDAYISEFSELETNKLTKVERDILTKRLMKLYMTGKLDNIDSIIEKMTKIEMDQPVFDGKMTLGEYVEDRKQANTFNIVKLLIGYMNEGIKKRMQEPEFVTKLMNLNSRLIAPKTDDVDVLEQLNIELLYRYKRSLQKFDLRETKMFETKGSGVHMTTTIFKMLKLLAGVKNYVKTFDKKVVFTNSSVEKLLEIAFPDCSSLPVRGPEPPIVISELLKSITGFRSINPSIVWKYYLSFVLLNGMEPVETDKTVEDLAVRVKHIGDTYMKIYLPRMRTQAEMKMMKMKSMLRKGDVIIYTLPECPACNDAKKFLTKWHMENNTNVSKPFVEKSSDDVPEELQNMLRDSDGYLSFPIIVIGGEYLGGLDKLKQLTAKQIRPIIASAGFAPPVESQMVQMEEEEEEDKDRVTGMLGALTGVVVAVDVAVNKNNVYDVYREYSDSKSQYEKRNAAAWGKMKQQVASNIYESMKLTTNKLISIQTERGGEVNECIETLSMSKMADFYSIEKALENYERQTKQYFTDLFSEQEFNRLKRNVFSSVIRELDVSPWLVNKLKEINAIDTELKPNVIELPNFRRKMIRAEPDQSIMKAYGGILKPMLCNLSSKLNTDIDDYIDCYSEATFDSSCPRLSRDIGNIFNDGIIRLTSTFQEDLKSTAIEVTNIQIDYMTDQATNLTVMLMFRILMFIAMYFIRRVYMKRVESNQGYIKA